MIGDKAGYVENCRKKVEKKDQNKARTCTKLVLITTWNW